MKATNIKDLEKRVEGLERALLLTTEAMSTLKKMIDILAGFKEKVHPL